MAIHNSQLFGRLKIRTIDLTKANRELRTAKRELERSLEQVRELSGHLQAVREQEREKLSREIHDELGQALTALKMDVAWIERSLPRKNPAELLEKTRSMSGLIDGTIQAVRRISTELRPGILDNLGLMPAVEWYAEDFQKRTGIRCRLDRSLNGTQPDKDLSTALFRILQESLTNVARHARATEVAISVRDTAGELRLEVRDNGRGIGENEAAGSKSIGLMGMRERVRLLGGRIELRGAPGEGTTVAVRIPMERKREVRLPANP